MCRVATNGMMVLALILPTLGWAAQEGTQRRDPLQPPGSVAVETSSTFNAGAWALMSTLVADGRRVAIINGRTVRRGDWVGGARVLTIAPGRVRLDYRGRQFTITRPVTRVRKGE